MTRWKIDSTHSEVNFKVKHLVVSTVTGHFGRFDALIESNETSESGDDDFADARVSFEADIDSINTKNGQRDAHLKSPDFFDAANHPKMTFVSTSVRKLSDHELRVTGDLTLRGVTKPVDLDVIYNGTVSGFGGRTSRDSKSAVKINRFDFGLQWSAVTETGGVVVSNEVKIEILAEFNQVPEAVLAA